MPSPAVSPGLVPMLALRSGWLRITPSSMMPTQTEALQVLPRVQASAAWLP
jgi:hypothetical protein